MTEAQLSTGYKSSNGFKDAFSRTMGAASPRLGNSNILKASRLDTPLGPMIAIANEEALYLLEFEDLRGLERKIERLRQRTQSAIIPGSAQPLCSIENELNLYFKGTLTKFNTPFRLLGSPFQKQVWEELVKIPFGETRSYSELAIRIGRPSAFRAVAQANASNQFAVMIPCHRVINTNGELGGYGGGIARKNWLINHERKAIS